MNNLTPGTYTLRAVALDNEGATDEEIITITVEDMNVPPTVSFVSPRNLQEFPAGTTLSVNVNAADADGAIAHVRLFLNNQLVRQDANAPYQWGINDVLLQNLSIGTYVLRALATDNEGSTTESSIVIQVVRTNQAPTLAFSTPTNGQEITSGTNLNVGVIANDSDGSIANVRLFFNEQLIRQITTPPYQWGTNDPLLQNLQPGNYNLRAVATDNEAATSETSIRIVVVKVNVPPIVAFTKPVNLQQFAVGTNLAVQVDATDSDGTINNVELYLNNQLVRQELAPPYEWGADDIALRNLQIGNYTLRAVATDDKGAKGETSINITVINGQPNVPPTLSFASPTNNQQFPAGTNLTVTANANDSDGSIAHVRLFLNNQLVRQDNASPYSWGTGDALLQNLQVGTYLLRILATDNRGLTAETSINITVTGQQSNVLPVVTITTPANNQQFPVGTNLTVTADANDSDGSVAHVRLFLNNQLVRQDNASPYSWGTGDALLQNLQVGTYTLRTVVTDNLGATAETSINIQIAATSNTSPTVSFTEPTQQAQLPVGTNLYVKVNASDDKGVRRVALYLNNQLVRFETGAPYEWGKSTQNDTALRNMAAGTYTLRAVAEDSEGNTGESTIMINIGTASSNMPPSVAFTAPTNEQVFPVGTNLTVNANASDTDGTIAHVRLFLNNTLVRQDNTAPYSWGTTDAALQNLAAGTYTLKVVATDDDSATTETSITIQVQTINTSQNPTVSFSQPANNQSFPTGTNLFVLVDASDSDGTIRDVVLYLNGILVRREAGAPYEWGKSTQNDTALRNMAAGTYTLRAVATDNQGNTGEASIQIQITGSGGSTSTFPVVSFVQPSNQSSFPVGTNLMVLVNASDADGGIANVQLYLNGQALRRETLPPYEWANLRK
ncbi:MAG: hypothetical protein HC892_10130 [Saprospiraceae bacterium]|nr:hypothetical protein [Saprospiraceae bacterium]